MGQVSAKLRRAVTGYSHWCPGCGEMHAISVLPGWNFNGNLEKPTFSPSVKITGKQSIVDEKGEWTGEWVLDADGKPKDYCCHYFLTDGVLNYCGDCTHKLSGQQVPLPDLPSFMRDDAA